MQEACVVGRGGHVCFLSSDLQQRRWACEPRVSGRASSFPPGSEGIFTNSPSFFQPGSAAGLLCPSDAPLPPHSSFSENVVNKWHNFQSAHPLVWEAYTKSHIINSRRASSGQDDTMDSWLAVERRPFFVFFESLLEDDVIYQCLWWFCVMYGNACYFKKRNVCSSCFFLNRWFLSCFLSLFSLFLYFTNNHLLSYMFECRLLSVPASSSLGSKLKCTDFKVVRTRRPHNRIKTSLAFNLGARPWQ